MTGGEVRADRVDQLLAIMTDETLTPDAKIELITGADVTARERMTAAQVLRDRTVADLLAAGGLHEVEPVRSSSVMDMTVEQFRTIAACYSILARWDVVIYGRARRLSDVLKIIPTDEAEAITRWLALAELIDPTEATDGDG